MKKGGETNEKSSLSCRYVLLVAAIYKHLVGGLVKTLYINSFAYFLLLQSDMCQIIASCCTLWYSELPLVKSLYDQFKRISASFVCVFVRNGQVFLHAILHQDSAAMLPAKIMCSKA